MAVIGVDREGILEAADYVRSRPSPLFFFSFEIMLAEETSRRFKAAEIEACAIVENAFVQDASRAELLSRENNLDPAKVSLIPVAPSGLGKNRFPRVRDEVGIPRNKKVAVLLGSIAGWGGSSEIVETVSEWPEDWVLLIHSRSSSSKELAALVKSSSGPRIYFSRQPYNSIDQLGHLLNGADAGLAFYVTDSSSRFTGENIRRIGLASGKIATYLSFGLPVITNAQFGYDTLLPEYGAGISVGSPSEIAGALTQLDLIEMRQGTTKLFLDRLDYRLFEEELLTKILGNSNEVASETNSDGDA